MSSQQDHWGALECQFDAIDKTALDGLMRGDVGCILSEFDQHACEALMARIRHRGLNATRDGQTLPGISSGVATLPYVDEDDYLSDAAAAMDERTQLLGDVQDPTDRVLDMLDRAWPGGAQLTRRGDQSYFGGVIRVLTPADTHKDFAPFDFKGWTIASVEHQLSWHVYLTAPQSGGDFHIWRRMWEEADEARYRDSSAARKYDSAFLDDVAKLTIAPEAGRFVLFNTRHYHAFDAVTGDVDCLVISAFHGVRDDQSPFLTW